jgi:hypothetical protein
MKQELRRTSSSLTERCEGHAGPILGRCPSKRGLAFNKRNSCRERTGTKNLLNSALHWSAQLEGTTTTEKRLAVEIALTIDIIAGSVFPSPGGSPIMIAFKLLSRLCSIFARALYWYALASMARPGHEVG